MTDELSVTARTLQLIREEIEAPLRLEIERLKDIIKKQMKPTEISRRLAECNELADAYAVLVIDQQALRIENWQLKGALGYEVPADIPCGDFKCGLCEAKSIELDQVRKNSMDLLGQLIRCEEWIEERLK